MAVGHRLISRSFPYLPLSVVIHGYRATFSAFLDTGFDGDVVLPSGTLPAQISPDHDTRWELADHSRILVPTFHGTAQLGQFAPFAVAAIVLGDEPIIGRQAIRRFSVTLDHGQRLVVEQ